MTIKPIHTACSTYRTELLFMHSVSITIVVISIKYTSSSKYYILSRIICSNTTIINTKYTKRLFLAKCKNILKCTYISYRTTLLINIYKVRASKFTPTIYNFIILF